MCLNAARKVLLEINFNKKIMTIGITGHQDIRDDETIGLIKRVIEKTIKDNHVTSGMSCLARGADQLFAKTCIEKNVDLIAVVPSEDYETTFEDDQILSQYHRLLSQAKDIVRMEFAKSTGRAFFEASKHLVNNSTILIAIWNGKPAKGFGGTADVFEYAMRQNKNIIHFNPLSKTIKNYNNGKP